LVLRFFLGKRIVITGASSGIGRCLAYWYLNNGARVALVGRDLEAMDAVAKQFPSQSMVVKCDLTIDM
jgi:short-subunit dehydrogenase